MLTGRFPVLRNAVKITVRQTNGAHGLLGHLLRDDLLLDGSLTLRKECCATSVTVHLARAQCQHNLGRPLQVHPTSTTSLGHYPRRTFATRRKWNVGNPQPIVPSDRVSSLERRVSAGCFVRRRQHITTFQIMNELQQSTLSRVALLYPPSQTCVPSNVARGVDSDTLTQKTDPLGTQAPPGCSSGCCPIAGLEDCAGGAVGFGNPHLHNRHSVLCQRPSLVRADCRC
mmetsp:Transcript_8000/g.18884  ORF Transcript_8000/g.18884 Transcript_8000/m.18884 type:complete len:228 (+) Transcript_8000:2010-2693(+)